jgi:chromosomal replication initiator protein
MQDLRSIILSDLKARIGSSSCESWFSKVDFILEPVPTSISVQVDGVANMTSSALARVKVICPSSFVKSWIELNYRDLLSFLIRNSLRINEVEIEFSVNNIKETLNLKKATGILSKISTPLNPRLTFENFIVDSSNEFAFQVMHNNSSHIFLNGASGNGKTHLGQALVKKAVRDGLHVCYINSQEYVYKFISAIRDDTLIQLKQALFNLDLLIIDDVQFMANKRGTQELLFEVLLQLSSQNKQLVMIGDSQLGLSDRILSRMSGELSVLIKEPSFSLKLKILENKSKKLVNKDVLNFMASTLHGSIRELEGAILRIESHIDFFGTKIDLLNINQILQDLHIQQKKEISIDTLFKVISEFYGISRDQLLSKSRVHILSHARSIAMFILRNLFKKSLVDIGKIFGNTSHTNALQNIRKTESSLKNNQHLRNELIEIEARLNGK